MFFVSTVAATSFGSFTFESSKFSEDLNATYTLGLMNPGDETVEVELGYPGSENYNVSFDRQSFDMAPTDVSGTPQSSGSYYLGDGRYAEVEEVEVLVEASRYRESNQIEFPVTVQTSLGEDEGTQETVYVQEHWLEMEIEPSLIPEEREEEVPSYQERFWDEAHDLTGSEEEDEEKSEEEEEFNFEEDETESSDDENQGEQNVTETQEVEDSEVDTVTYVLLIGLLVSLVYLYRVY